MSANDSVSDTEGDLFSEPSKGATREGDGRDKENVENGWFKGGLSSREQLTPDKRGGWTKDDLSSYGHLNPADRDARKNAFQLLQHSRRQERSGERRARLKAMRS